MGITYLSVELAFDFIAFVLGIVLVHCAKDNYQRLYWGIIASGVGLVFMWENIGWLLIVTDTPSFQFTELLSIEKMLKWYGLASVVCLFPIASLSPGYLNHFRILTFLLPPIVIITVGICYIWFNGEITPIHSLSDIIYNSGQLDVKLRITIFLLSVFIPLIQLIYPLLSNKTYRKINRNMYMFIGFLFLFLTIYVLFTLNINEFIFNLFGISAITFAILFSIQYLRYENPFSDHVSMLQDSDKKTFHGQLPQPLPLFVTIDSFLKETHPYTDSNYSIEQLAESQGEKARTVSDAIKSEGFTGFREYMNSLRLEYFRQLAISEPDKNIKELMFLSGFTSRSTFYRNFLDKYGISPTKYIDKQKGEKS